LPWRRKRENVSKSEHSGQKNKHNNCEETGQVNIGQQIQHVGFNIKFK
jgi:hypothetical protein